MTIQAAHRAANKSYHEFIEKNCTQKKEADQDYIIVPFEHNDRYRVLSKRVQQTFDRLFSDPKKLPRVFGEFLRRILGQARGRAVSN